MPTYEQAIDEIYSTFYASWNANATGVLGYTPAAWFEGQGGDFVAPLDDYWARLSVRNANEDSVSVGQHGATSGRLYQTAGLLSVEIYGPKSDHQAVANLRKLAQFVRHAYRVVVPSGEVWYTEATIRERPPEDRLWRIDVTAVYNYTEVA